MTARTLQDPAERYLDGFALGDVIVTRGRTIEASDIVTFAGLTGDFYPLHVDEEYSKNTRFGTRIAHGPFTFAVAVGLVGMTGYYGNAIIALLETKSIRALGPVVSGDTIRAQAEVIACEAPEDSRHGSLSVAYSVLNQRDEEVMTFVQVMLARRRPEPEGNDDG